MKQLYVVTLVLAAGFVLSCSGSKPAATDESKSHAAGTADRDSKDDKSANKSEEGSPGAEGKGKDEDAKNDSIDLSPETQKRLGIAIATASKSRVPIPLVLTGTVEPIESRMGHVRPLARGQVREVLVKVGDHVTAGSRLAQFDNIEAGELATQYESANAELARLKIQATTQARQVERNRNLVGIGAIAQKELELSQAEQQAIEESIHAQQRTIAGLQYRLTRFGVSDPGNAVRSSLTTVTSPFGGVITKVSASLGDVVDSSSELFTIANLATVYVEAQVYAKDLARVHLKQTATVTVESYPGEVFLGHVVSIGDIVDPQTRTTPVRCEVANPKDRLKVGLFATVNLPTESKQAALTVRSDAVQNYEGKSVVFLRQGDKHFLVRPVQVGQIVGETAEITAGLKEGEGVVSHGAFQIKSALLAKELGEDE